MRIPNFSSTQDRIHIFRGSVTQSSRRNQIEYLRIASGKLLDKKHFGLNESSLKQDLEYDQLIINPRTDWSLIADRLIEPISRPVNLRRTSSANNTNPWGSTVSIIRI